MNALTWMSRLEVRASLCVVLAAGAICFLHDQALWQAEDSREYAAFECLCEVDEVLPKGYRRVSPSITDVLDSVERVADQTYDVTFLVELEEDETSPRPRMCRARIVCNGYGDWSIRSVQIEGERQEVVEHRHVFEGHIDELWLGFYVE